MRLTPRRDLAPLAAAIPAAVVAAVWTDDAVVAAMPFVLAAAYTGRAGCVGWLRGGRAGAA